MLTICFLLYLGRQIMVFKLEIFAEYYNTCLLIKYSVSALNRCHCAVHENLLMMRSHESDAVCVV